MILSILAAAASSGDGETLLQVVQTGGAVITPAALVLLFMTNRLHTHGEMERADAANQMIRDENQRLREQIAMLQQQQVTLQTGLVDKAIPALTRATLVLENLSPQVEVSLRRQQQGRQQTRGG